MKISAVKRLFVGSPLATAQARHERLSKPSALAVFASDALSSVAYATEEILLVLVVAGAAALALLDSHRVRDRGPDRDRGAAPTGRPSWPIRRAAARTSSPRTTSARWPGLIAAAALLIDYVLTVAVSVAAGVAAITSAFPALYDYRVAARRAVHRGRSRRRTCAACASRAALFAVPTYLFVGELRGMLAVRVRRLALRHGRRRRHPSRRRRGRRRT